MLMKEQSARSHHVLYVRISRSFTALSALRDHNLKPHALLGNLNMSLVDSCDQCNHEAKDRTYVEDMRRTDWEDDAVVLIRLRSICDSCKVLRQRSDEICPDDLQNSKTKENIAAARNMWLKQSEERRSISPIRRLLLGTRSLHRTRWMY
jgi:hypothetical protein